MRISIQWTVAVVLSLALPLAAQEIPTVGETIDVRVVNVETVVTSASGERVRGLTAADFRLLVDGREVPVEYFAEIEEGTSVVSVYRPRAFSEVPEGQSMRGS